MSFSTKKTNNFSENSNDKPIKKVIIGVCAMERKANSKPMRAIMSRMCDYYKDYIEFKIFPEEVILNDPVEHWPICDCLISFHSTDFPLCKAIEYERLRRPYILNDLNRQYDLLDRRKVFHTLASAGIDHPRHCVVLRDENGELISGDLTEVNDYIEVNGMIFNKPFVEKPISAEDHNVYIYFPSSVGGGSQRLFRKVNDRSSWYSPVSNVRYKGSYIYEEFIPADGTDVKVYAVGPYYAHAEARKAPGLDGKVERDADGKEVRYPVILSAREKMIARRVVLAFGQTVCGFDLLRANGRSFVCDVNGFSFVKTSTKYYEDTAKILGNMILYNLASSLNVPWHVPFEDVNDSSLTLSTSGKIMELRCVIAVIRHGDRTPKQKMKTIVSDDRFFELFKKYDGIRRKEIKMKRPNQLMEVLDLIRIILAEQQALRDDYIKKTADNRGDVNCEEFKFLERELEKCEENVKTWDQMRTVLEMYGHFSGINRKVQLKYLKPKDSTLKKNLDQQQKNILSDPKPKLMLILKWGGELTTAGVLQAEALGKLFRTLYPGIRRTDGRDCPEDTQGLGFLRLHSTYRHDLKIYSSDEGRVQMTAAAFTKGLLALEGELTPILMQMVKSANTDGLLNDYYNARQFQNELKSYLHSALQVDRDFTSEDYQNLNPSGLRSLANAMEFIKNPRKMCHEIAGYVQRMCEIIRWHKHQNSANEKNKTLYLNETWELAERRWSKELREFRKVGKSGDGSVDFDISKIPDIYDNIKYDMEHNPDLCINNEGEFERFYLCVKNMADIVVPQEYGISDESKICIAQRVCSPLMSKMRNDLHRCVQNPKEDDETLTRLDPRASEGIATPMRHVRTRLYFTSESHIHTLMNLIRYGGLCSSDDKKWQRAMNFLSGVTEFNYMTQVVLMVYEDSRNEGKIGTERFHIELLFSPGLYPCFQTEKERIYETRFNSKKQQMNHQKSSTKTKNLSGKSSSDTSDKEITDLEGFELVTSSSNDKKAVNQFFVEENNESKKLQTDNSIKSQNVEEQIKSINEEDEDDELADNSVNLVVLGEVSCKEFAPNFVSGNNDISRLSPTTISLARKRLPSYEKNLTPTTKDDKPLASIGEISDITINAEKLNVDQSIESEQYSQKEILLNKSVASSLTQKIVKSMSDVNCYKKHNSLNSNNQNVFELNVPKFELDPNQATVGHGRGEWAKEISGNKKEANQQELNKKKIIQISSNDRVPLASMFLQDQELLLSDFLLSEEDKIKQLNLNFIIKEDEVTASTSTIKDDDLMATAFSRKSRFPYRFKHHTVNLLSGDQNVENRLISTDVLMGKFADAAKRKIANNSVVLSTAVIARSSSAPRLQTYKASDEIPVSEIRRFWPPLRSLETMHDNIDFKDFDVFLERMMKNSTPLPSPPKTPIQKETSADAQATLNHRLKDTIKKLTTIEKIL